MFARLLRDLFGGSVSTLRSPNRAPIGSGFEWLEDRTAPAIIIFNVNTANDTKLAGFGFNPITFQMAPLDANGNTSLRAVVEWANANPQTGAWNANRVEANLGLIAGQTITLKDNQPQPEPQPTSPSGRSR